MEVSEAVKHGVSKLEGATQKCEFWGQIWGHLLFILHGNYLNNI